MQTYVAERSPQGALTLIRELRARCECLAGAPRGYPLVPRHEHFDIRARPFGNFLIFYRAGDAAVSGTIRYDRCPCLLRRRFARKPQMISTMFSATSLLLREPSITRPLSIGRTSARYLILCSSVTARGTSCFRI